MCTSNRKHYVYPTHSSPLADRLTPKQVVISRLHDTVMKFFTSLRYNNVNELTLGWLAPAWHFLVVSCILKQMKSRGREPEWTRTDAKVALESCKHPLRAPLWGKRTEWWLQHRIHKKELQYHEKAHLSLILFYMWIYRAWVQHRYSNPELCNNSTLRSVPKQLNQISDR